MANYFFIFVLIFIFFYIFFRLAPTRRKKEIKEIISDLEELKKNEKYRKPAEDNIIFFRSAQTVLKYIWWLFFIAPKMRRKKEELLELADLPLPKWQKETHLRLTKLEKLSFPGLIKPIKKEIIKNLLRIKKTKKDPLILLNAGSGGAELEGQVLNELFIKKFDLPIIFICVEISPHILEIGIDNINKNIPYLYKKKIKIKKLDKINYLILEDLKKEAAVDKKNIIVFLNNNIFSLNNGLLSGSIDLIYHSRLRHHLTIKEQNDLEKLEIFLSSRIIEFDDFCSIPVFIFPSIITWRWPVTLNGAILSYLRDFSKKELLSFKEKKGWRLIMYKNLGYYLMIYDESKK